MPNNELNIDNPDALNDLRREKPRFERTDMIICVIMTIAAALVFGRDISVGGFRFPDASVHAMDGVLIRDFVAAGLEAWFNPKEFALQQYAHYPSLGMVGVYPPGFAIVEALFFGVFGVSVFSARLCAAAFGLAAVVGCYMLARRMTDRTGAVLATAALVAVPGIVIWTRQVMLEMPTLAILIWTAYATDAYFRKPGWLRLATVCVLAIAAPLFKQNAIFVIPLLGLIATYMLWRKRMCVAHYLTALTVIGLPIGLYYGWAIFAEGAASHVELVVTENRTLEEWRVWSQITFHLAAFRQFVGWPVSILAMLGALITLRLWDWRWGMMFGWFVLFASMTFFLQHAGLEERYFYFGYFPLTMWAGLGAAWLLKCVKPFAVKQSVLIGASTAAFVSGYLIPMQPRPDHAPIVGAYAEQMRHRLVLFEGRQDGGFIFAARRLLGPQECAVMRGSKIFYSCFAMPKYGFESHVSSRADVAQIIENIGFDLIFAERQNKYGLKEVDFLRQELNDQSRYELIGSHTISQPEAPTDRHSVVVDVYRPRFFAERPAREIEVPIPMIGRAITIDFENVRRGAATRSGQQGSAAAK